MKTTIYKGLLLSIMVFSCSNSSTDDLTIAVNEEKVTIIKYETDVKAILSSNCIFCHGETPKNGATTSYHTYLLSKNAIDGIINRINSVSSPMPPRGLMTEELRNTVQKWKDDGLLEN